VIFFSSPSLYVCATSKTRGSLTKTSKKNHHNNNPFIFSERKKGYHWERRKLESTSNCATSYNLLHLLFKRQIINHIKKGDANKKIPLSVVKKAYK
jgi:hypothetical protein